MNLDAPNYRWLVPVQEHDQNGFSWKSPKDEYHEKENKLPLMRKDLPPDNLTATYWG
jgi:hypothetical protein